MAKLTRIIQKIFGIDGGSGEFGQFGSNAASPPGSTTKDLTVIQSLQEYLDGWYAATANANEPPRIQDRNALDLLFSSQLTYLFQNGIPEWLDDADQRYYEDVSFVTKGGVIYVAIQGDDGGNINAEKDPETEPTWWTPILEALEDAVVLNTTHRGSDGKNHSDVVLNNTHRGSDGSDHDFIDQDVKIAASPTLANLTINNNTISKNYGYIFASGSNIINTMDPPGSGSNSNSFVLMGDCFVPGTGIVNIRFGIRNSTGGVSTAKIYKNGVPVGTERSTTSVSLVYFTEDISVEYGDMIEIYGKTASGTIAQEEFTIQVSDTTPGFIINMLFGNLVGSSFGL